MSPRIFVWIFAILLLVACSSAIESSPTPTNTSIPSSTSEPSPSPTFTQTPTYTLTATQLPTHTVIPTLTATLPPQEPIRQILPDNEAVFSSDFRQIILRWEEAPGAISYQVETLLLIPGQNCWWPREKLVQHWFRTIDVEGNEYVIEHYGTNPYCWRVWAVYPDEIYGPSSDWRIIYFK